MYLALGDSYTIGESVNTNLRFPIQLADSLKQIDLNISEVKIIAKTGWTTDELKKDILSQKPLDNYDLVTLLIGVNNQYRGRDIENYRQEFVELLNMAINFAGNNKDNVIVISIPDWGVTPFAKDRDTVQISKEIDAFNIVILEETDRLKVKFVDVTPISREAKNDSSLIANDGLHPSGKMYKLWTKEILPKASLILKSK